MVLSQDQLVREVQNALEHRIQLDAALRVAQARLVAIEGILARASGGCIDFMPAPTLELEQIRMVLVEGRP